MNAEEKLEAVRSVVRTWRRLNPLPVPRISLPKPSIPGLPDLPDVFLSAEESMERIAEALGE